MRSAHAFQPEPSPADRVEHDRRPPASLEDLGPPSPQEDAVLRWPASWAAAVYVGDSGAQCTVRTFSATGAKVSMQGPPPVGALVSLKFPFTVFLKGRVVWSQAEDLGIEFDEDTRRSARIVETVLLDKTRI